LVAIIAVVLASTYSSPFAQTLDEILEAAEEGKNLYLQSIPRLELVRAGLPDDFREEHITLGTPLNVYFLTPDNFQGKTETDIFSLMNKTSIWYCPLIYQGNYVSILTVGFLNGSWKAVGMGKAGFALELGEIVKMWPQEPGYNHHLVKIVSMRSDFIAIRRNDQWYFSPFASARAALGSIAVQNEPDLLSFDDLIGIVRNRKNAKE
jgi:hypothetical protein